MITPTPDEVLDALKQHPTLLANVAHNCALLLVDEWATDTCNYSVRHLACTRRTHDSRVAWVERLDNGQWGAVTGSGRVAGKVYDTIEDAKAAADDSIRRMGYIVIDTPFNAMRGIPRRRYGQS